MTGTTTVRTSTEESPVSAQTWKACGTQATNLSGAAATKATHIESGTNVI